MSRGVAISDDGSEDFLQILVTYNAECGVVDHFRPCKKAQVFRENDNNVKLIGWDQ